MEDPLKIEKTIRPDGTCERFEIPLGGCIHVISLESGEKIARDILSLLDIEVAQLEDIKAKAERLVNFPFEPMYRDETMKAKEELRVALGWDKPSTPVVQAESSG